MNDVALHSIELCAGIGMLGEGVRAALEYLGCQHRTVCYVEREASAAGQLAALMETGALDEAPIWSDLLTFDGAAWRGRVHCVIAGFPCQDLSVAGRRAGLNGKRSGLFFNVLDIADACGAQFLVLENVSGITSATAAVVDETEGELDERAAARVLGELADRGWNAEWMHLRASDVGANHQRERWFCIAWRNVADAVWNVGHRGGDGESWGGRGIREASASMANADDDGGQGRGISAPGGRIEHSHSERTGAAVGDTGCACNGAHEPERLAECCRSADAGSGCCAMVDAERSERWPISLGGSGSEPRQDGERQASGRLGVGGSTLGHSNSARSQGRRDVAGKRGSEWAARTPGVGDIFAPGPLDARWSGIVTDRPDLAPATEPGIHMLADGMAYLVDESRNHQLRQAGNGVVALQAATAIIELLQRAGFSRIA